jgi:hypothetical protein
MPTLSDKFSAYPITVRLDANGNGTIRFQATGKNIVVTNLYTAVETSTRQAVRTIYKGQVAPSAAINVTNSGSTGAAAHGRIELLDGEAIFVVWTGGDANALANATFTGYSLPFNIVSDGGGTEFFSDDPIAAGDGTLIFPAIQSVNYVAGVSGWRLDRDGDLEANNGTFRGDVNVIDPVTGEGVIIEANNPFTGIDFKPADSTTIVPVVDNGHIRGIGIDTVGAAYGELHIQPPRMGFSIWPQLRLTQAGASPYGSNMLLQDAKLLVDSDIININDDLVYMRGEQNEVNVSVTAATSATQVVNFTGTFNAPPVVTCNINSGNGLLARWGVRAINVTTTQFTIFLFRGDNTDPALTLSVPVQWRATSY